MPPGAVYPDDGFFPEAFTLELDLIEVARQFVTGLEQPASTTRTVIGALTLDLRAVPAIPEPSAALLYAAGLVALRAGARRSR